MTRVAPDGFADDEHVGRHAPSTLLQRLVPRQLRGYRRAWLREDLLAGITITALVVPLGLAFAELAGLPAVYGLYTSIVPVLVFAWIASTPQAVMGAEAALAGIVAVATTPIIAQGYGVVETVASLSIIVGVICLLGAVLRLGRIAQLVSRPVFAGYLSGVAVAVTMSQVPKIVGAPAFTSSTFFGQLQELPATLADADPYAAVIGITTVAVVLAGRVLAPRVPVALAAILLASIASWMLARNGHPVPTVGTLPRSFPDLTTGLLPVAALWELLPAAAVIALIGFVDTTVVTQGFAARNGYRVDSTRDLAAQGAADVASGMFGGLPLSASTARTAVADAGGAHSQVAPAASALGIVVVLIAFAGLMVHVPQAALGGIVAAVMIGVADVPTLRRLAATRRRELAVALAAFGGVLVLGILEGVLVAVVASLAVFIHRAISPHDAVLGHVEGERGWYASDERPDVQLVDGLLVYRFDSPLFFANVDTFRARLLELCARHPDARHIIIEGEAITDVDYTASRVLEELVLTLRADGVTLAFAELNHAVVERLQRDGLVDSIGADAFHRTLTGAEAAWTRRSGDADQVPH